MEFNFFTRNNRKLSNNDQMILVKRLSFLMKSGVPLPEGILMLTEEQKDGWFKRALEKINEKISHGQSLASSLSQELESFNEFGINIIHIGETTGALDSSLEYLSEELKKKGILRRKIVGAFIYPIVVTFSSVVIILFLILYLFPKIIPVFKSLNLDLPRTTSFLISLSIFLKNYWAWLILSFIAIFALTTSLIKRNQKIRYIWHKALLKIPLIKGLVTKYTLVNSTRTLGLLLKSGVPLEEALVTTSHATSNLVYRNEFLEAAKTVRSGSDISKYFKKSKNLFPNTAISLISAGEKSGNLENSFFYLSEFFEQEVDDLSKNLANLMEPFLMIIMGLIVGFIAFSIITPVYDITQNLRPK